MIWEDNGNADREREALVIENKPVGIGCKFSERNGSVVVREILHGGPAQVCLVRSLC